MKAKEISKLFGPLAPLLEDRDVTAIMIDGAAQIYVERKSLEDKFEDVPSPFRDDAHLLEVINAVLAPLGRRVDAATPLVDVRLADGSRLHAVIPPISLAGPAVIIRRFFPGELTVEDLRRFGTWDEAMVAFLRACVQARANMLVAGGTASGKTTVLANVASMIPPDERIIVIESATELQLPQRYVVRLEPRPADIEGKGAVTVRDLMGSALHMRPDRVILAEVLVGQAQAGVALLELLYAMNRGHEGNLIGIHATSPRDALSRLETLAAGADPANPLLQVRQEIAAAIQLIIYQERLRDGTRKVLKISEVQGMQGDAIALQEIWEFRQTGFEEGQVVGRFTPTGQIPRLLSRIREAGINLPVEIFTPQ